MPIRCKNKKGQFAKCSVSTMRVRVAKPKSSRAGRAAGMKDFRNLKAGEKVNFTDPYTGKTRSGRIVSLDADPRYWLVESSQGTQSVHGDEIRRADPPPKPWRGLSAGRKSRAKGGKRIVITYETYTPASLRHSEAEERGYEDEEGVKVDSADEAIDFLKGEGATEPSSSMFWPGRSIWYTSYGSEDFRTREITNRSFHLKGFTEAEMEKIFTAMSAKRRGRAAGRARTKR